MADAARLSDADVADLTERLAARPLPSARPRGDVVDIVSRRPLGLQPVIEDLESGDDDDDQPEDIASPPIVRADNRTATLVDIDYLVRHALRGERKYTKQLLGKVWGPALAQVAAEGNDAVRLEVKALLDRLDGKPGAETRNEIAELKLTIGEMRNEATALRLVLENLRIREKGEQGRDGDRGPPGVAGRDGLQGPIGPAGPRGERGLPTPKIVAWEPDLVRFTVTPCLANGTRAATLPLRELLIAFADSISDDDE